MIQPNTASFIPDFICLSPQGAARRGQAFENTIQ